MNYAEMSDLEINVAVAKKMGFDSELFLKAVANGETPLYGELFDPCNLWGDAGPIIQENMISIDRHYNGSYSRVWGYSEKGLHEVQALYGELLRSAMIVFLMMKGGEQ